MSFSGASRDVHREGNVKRFLLRQNDGEPPASCHHQVCFRTRLASNQKAKNTPYGYFAQPKEGANNPKSLCETAAKPTLKGHVLLDTWFCPKIQKPNPSLRTNRRIVTSVDSIDKSDGLAALESLPPLQIRHKVNLQELHDRTLRGRLG